MEITIEGAMLPTLITYLGARGAYWDVVAAASDQSHARIEVELGVEDSYLDVVINTKREREVYDGARGELAAFMARHGLVRKLPVLDKYHVTVAGPDGIDAGHELLDALGVTADVVNSHKLVLV